MQEGVLGFFHCNGAGTEAGLKAGLKTGLLICVV